jgi:hypothetical protein
LCVWGRVAGPGVGSPWWGQGELSQELAGGLDDDADVPVLHEQQDVGSGVGSSDADVVQAAVVADGDRAGVVDAVAADPLMGG